MPRPRQVAIPAITLRLQASGPLSAPALAAALRVDDSNIRRALALPEISPHLVRLGTRRGATYALRRPIRNLGDTFPLRRVDADGRAHDWAELAALHGGWQLTWADAARPPAWAGEICALGRFCEGFPFFLSELRPQGFLGRAAGRSLPLSLGLSPDPREWPNDDDTLVYLAAEGDDLPGDLLIGDAMLRRAQVRLLNPPAALPDFERTTRYPELATAATSSGIAGSSVEGEQPKFLATLSSPPPQASPRGMGVPPVIDGEASRLAAPSLQFSGLQLPPPFPTPVIVKFTDVLSTPTGRRWADLLAAEAHALTLLHAHGEAHAAPRLLDAADRRFLETPRYDRVGPHGRRGVVSLRALHDAFGGPDAHLWTAAAANLRARDLINDATLRSIRLRHAFGRLIGNTDMHFGNLAFWFDDSLPFLLAPGYDQLPMLWAPAPGNATPSPDFAPTLPLPAEREIWHEAAALADEFWQRVIADPRVSRPFAAIATAALATVRRLRAVA